MDQPGAARTGQDVGFWHRAAGSMALLYTQTRAVLRIKRVPSLLHSAPHTQGSEWPQYSNRRFSLPVNPSVLAIKAVAFKRIDPAHTKHPTFATPICRSSTLGGPCAAALPESQADLTHTTTPTHTRFSMAAVDSPRSPPALGPAFKQGSLRLDFDLRPTTAVNILETYSPFPTLGPSRDPFNLDTFLLHPSEVPWEFLNNSPFPGEALLVTGNDKPKRSEAPNNRMSMLRRPSPLASNPPLSAMVEEDEDDEDEDESEASTPGPLPPRRPLSAAVGGKAFRALMNGNRKSNNPLLTAESDTPDTIPTTPEEPLFDPPQLQPPDRRSMYSLSGSSSEDSCDGLQTPTSSNSAPTDVTSRLAAALQEDQQRQEDQQLRKNNRTSWRDWLGGRRTSFLGLRGGESGNTLLESPRASVVDLIPEEDVTGPVIPDSELARSAQLLRRLSLIKLGSLRLPSPHPLASVLERQSAHLPNEVAFAIPASRRVYPKSVNVVRRCEPLPAQPGLRIALGLRDVIQRIDAGERPTELLNLQRRTPLREGRARGVRDFVARRPFEERNVVYYPDDWVEEVSMARPGFGVWDLDFSDYMLALADTEERPPLNYTVRSKSQARQPRPSLSAAPVVTVTTAESARQSLKQLPKTTAPALAPAQATTPGPAATKDTPPTRTSVPSSSFRTPRSKPSTWDDSSDDDGDSDSAPPQDLVPVRPQTTRNQTAPAAIKASDRSRQSRLIDATTALEMVTASRDRRHEGNMNHVQRKAVTDQRRVSTMILEEQEKRRTQYAKSVHDMRRPQPSKRVSSMTLSGDAHAAALNKRASNLTLAATAAAHRTSSNQHSPPDSPGMNRPAASLPPSPRLQSGNRRRAVSHYEPTVDRRRSPMNINSMYGGLAPMVPMHTGMPSMAPMHTGIPAMVPMHTGMAPMGPMAPMHTGMMAPMHHHRASMMMPVQPMVPLQHGFAPQYAPQFAHGNSPHMYLQPPPPATGRYRERPVA
ncbi:hypothetical protein CspeluHIS016_0701320 [Cutaneotrichosporon spelunceum]|uniref:Uncharacterized protein n=1 Tax=Cutaneotrichosporon spelunceum TaxID=1672016 RepID=A0AAD3TYA7_9TREE|nr:hypothetical protein CspeluHIS016_0701320 [Cutaneotrichosporon spelunceum]